MSQVESSKERQYGEWLRAGSVVRNGSEKGKAFDGRNTDYANGEDVRSRPRSTVANVSSVIVPENVEDGGRNSSNDVTVRKASIMETLIRDTNSNYSEGDSLCRWDMRDETARGLRGGSGSTTKCKRIWS